MRGLCRLRGSVATRKIVCAGQDDLSAFQNVHCNGRSRPVYSFRWDSTPTSNVKMDANKVVKSVH
jgi:hypothetical protein